MEEAIIYLRSPDGLKIRDTVSVRGSLGESYAPGARHRLSLGARLTAPGFIQCPTRRATFT
jgi:hypothetical protein